MNAWIYMTSRMWHFAERLFCVYATMRLDTACRIILRGQYAVAVARGIWSPILCGGITLNIVQIRKSHAEDLLRSFCAVDAIFVCHIYLSEYVMHSGWQFLPNRSISVWSNDAVIGTHSIIELIFHGRTLKYMVEPRAISMSYNGIIMSMYDDDRRK